jgi:hypothetical protein
MKKLMTQTQRERKEARGQLMIGLLLIGLMLFSTVGFAFGNNIDSGIKKIEYNGVDFIRDNSGYWKFNLQGAEFYSLHNPEETKDIGFLNYLSLENYFDKPLYLVGDSESFSEITGNLNGVVLRFPKACYLKDCDGDFPVKNCSENLLVIKEPVNEEESIRLEDNCVFITAKKENQSRYVDAFLFKILGI